jgi:hydrogenase maturation protease
MKQTLIAGIGNDGMQDELAGLYLLRQLKKNLPNSIFNFYNLGNNLLNITKFYQNERNIFLLTAGNLNKKPGEYEVFPIEKISDYNNLIGISSPLVENLHLENPELLKTNIWVLAIQKKWNEWGNELSPEIAQAIKQIIHIFWHILETLDLLGKK